MDFGVDPSHAQQQFGQQGLQQGMQHPSQQGMQGMQPGIQHPSQQGMQQPIQPGQQGMQQPIQQHQVQPGLQQPPPVQPLSGKGHSGTQTQPGEVGQQQKDLQQGMQQPVSGQQQGMQQPISGQQQGMQQPISGQQQGMQQPVGGQQQSYQPGMQSSTHPPGSDPYKQQQSQSRAQDL